MYRFAIALWLGCFVTAPAWTEDAPATPDAPLRAMHMADAREGWAVGDDGLILHTVDGWETWETQRTRLRVSLRSVHFVDSFVGYAVGMEVLPYGRGTGGVVLATEDGGATWKKLIHRELPGLVGVRFVDTELGYAWGDTFGGNASGLFRTDNGGRSWKVCSTLGVTPGWACGTLINEQPVLAGPQGTVGLFEKEQVLPLPQRGLEACCLTAMSKQGHDVWVVGTHATVMLSRQTGGKSFEPVKLAIPDNIVGLLDFNTVSCQGDHVWIAGRPGSVVFHSWDRGKSWEAQRTGQPLPLHQLCFISETQGYALGELGTILQTGDGGKTWQLKRRGGHRAAALFVTSQSQQLPLGTMALTGGDKGYLTVGLQATVMQGQWRTDRDRLSQAVRAVGGCTSDVLTHMPVADYQQHLAAGQMMTLCEKQNLLEQLVLSLRMWRPSVVVCDSPDVVSPAGAMGSAVALTLRQACDICSRADIFPDHFTKLGLEPWQPVRLFCRQTPGSTADCTINLDLPRPVLFASANDFANLARPALFDHFITGPNWETFTLWKNWTDLFIVVESNMLLALRHVGPLGFALPVTMGPEENLFAGISLGHGGQARREKVEVDDLRYQLLLGATWQQKQEARSFQQRMLDPMEFKQFFNNFEKSLNGLAMLTRGDRIAAQAQWFVEHGQWTMARECHLMLIDQLPTHRLAAESCRFIATTMGSSEIKRRVDLGKMPYFADYVLMSPASKQGVASDALGEKHLLTQRSVLQRRRLELRRWNGGSLAAAEIYSVLHPLGYTDPELQMCLIANERLDNREEANLMLRQTGLQFKEPQGQWNDVVAGEQWLTQRIGTPPRTTMQAARVKAMPKLDGKLDDAVWNSIPKTVLKQASGQAAPQTTVQFAFDDTYLYLGVQCQQAAGMPVQSIIKPRKRDDDLRNHDRISLLLDMDRDYGTYFHFEFDARGCVMEDCCGDLTWNPQWFIEVCPTKEGWTAEVAIPLIELTSSLKLESEAWAANVTRIIPGVGVQGASLPTSVKPLPAGMGLLLFGDNLTNAVK